MKNDERIVFIDSYYHFCTMDQGLKLALAHTHAVLVRIDQNDDIETLNDRGFQQTPTL